MKNPLQIERQLRQFSTGDVNTGPDYPFSILQLLSCLDHLADGVVLINGLSQIIHASPRLSQIVNKGFSLSPIFTLHAPDNASRFAAFVDGKLESSPLSLYCEGEKEGVMLLLTCFRLQTSAPLSPQTACFMIKVNDPTRVSLRHWRFFISHFNLTPAEARLCHDLAMGAAIQDYCRRWRVAVSTARSQLNAVFRKTSTRRQAELLRLIFLFTKQ